MTGKVENRQKEFDDRIDFLSAGLGIWRKAIDVS